MPDLDAALAVLTMIGLAAFAISGALSGARVGMDWLGLSTLAAVTAIGGGTLRDILMTRTPGWLIDFWPTLLIIAGAVLELHLPRQLKTCSRTSLCNQCLDLLDDFGAIEWADDPYGDSTVGVHDDRTWNGCGRDAWDRGEQGSVGINDAWEFGPNLLEELTCCLGFVLHV